jgi:ATP/maltotriose-dependent transcriptional regulator MalT
VVDEPFVGRTLELNALRQQFERSGAGGRVVLITGPAGIGKTALIRRSLAALPARATWACGDPDETALAGGVLLQLALSAAGPAGEQLAGVLQKRDASPLSAGTALLAVFAELAVDGPQVVVIDDGQWADELSLKALSFACRRLYASPVLCVIAARRDSVAAFPRGLMRAVDDRGHRLDLAGLGYAEVAALAELAGAGKLPARAARRLCEHAAGVPLHVRELLHDLPADVLRNPGTTLPAPRSLELLVLSRLAGCAPETERLVVAVSVLGTSCQLADAAALAGLADPLAALQEATQQRLLKADLADRRRCAFPHALIRTAVYGDIGVSRRAELHRAAAKLTVGVAALAHRAAGCRCADPELAADLDAQARADQAAGKSTEAAHYLLTAALVDAQGPGRDRRLIEAVGMLIDVGDVARAHAYAEEIGAFPPSPSRSLILGRLAVLSGQHQAGERWIADAWAALGHLAPPDPQEREGTAVAACQLALMLIGQQRRNDAVLWAQRAADTAVTGYTRACSCAVQGGLLAAAGRPDEARTLLEAELERGTNGPGRALIRFSLATALLRGDHLAGAAAQLDAAVLCADLPTAHMLEGSLIRVLVDYRSGNWDCAAAEADRLLTLIDDLDQGWLLARAHLSAVYVAAGRGQWRRAAEHAQAAAAQAGAAPAAMAIDLADAHAAIASAQGDHAHVVALAEPVLDGLGSLADLEPTLLSFWPAYAHALAQSRRLDEADRTLRLFEDLARTRSRRSSIAAAGRVRGCLEGLRGQPEAARAAFNDSIDHLAGLCMPFEEGLTRLEYGRFLRRHGRRRAAVAEMSIARSLFAELRAQPFIARCDTELCNSPQAPAAALHVPLTARQLAVATAVAAGKSNREVAAEFYISLKTVEFHVSQILTRLGVDTRTEIAAAMAVPTAAHRS